MYASQPANHISTLRGCLPISVEAVVINFRDVAAQHSSQIAVITVWYTTSACISFFFIWFVIFENKSPRFVKHVLLPRGMSFTVHPVCDCIGYGESIRKTETIIHIDKFQVDTLTCASVCACVWFCVRVNTNRIRVSVCFWIIHYEWHNRCTTICDEFGFDFVVSFSVFWLFYFSLATFYG